MNGQGNPVTGPVSLPGKRYERSIPVNRWEQAGVRRLRQVVARRWEGNSRGCKHHLKREKHLSTAFRLAPWNVASTHFPRVWEERKIAPTLPCRQHGAYAPRITIVRPYTNKKTNIRTNGILSIPHDCASAIKRIVTQYAKKIIQKSRPSIVLIYSID